LLVLEGAQMRAVISSLFFNRDKLCGGGKTVVATYLDANPAMTKQLRAAVTEKIKGERLRSTRLGA
jgi:hypothetical protein